jgi:hypothetical protein
MKGWRWFAGPQPVLRLIAMLLAIIAVLLTLILLEARKIQHVMPTTDCGFYYNPCQVQLSR